MVEDLKYFDGELAEIGRIPEDIKQRFLTAFDIDPNRAYAPMPMYAAWPKDTRPP